MQNAQYFYRLAFYPVRHNIRKARNYHFPRAGNAACPADTRMISEIGDGLKYAVCCLRGCCRMIFSNVILNCNEVLNRFAQPLNFHLGGFLSFFEPHDFNHASTSS